MNRTPPPLYLDMPARAAAALAESITRGVDAATKKPVPVFFRADDIGVMSESFIRLMELFSRRRLPLNLAVVPAWISATRWSAIRGACDVSSPLWCWHQHGWRHRNHQTEGKKGEFGSCRKDHEIAADLLRGRDRLQNVLGPCFSPFFTPPWNRCTDSTLRFLKKSGFMAVSTHAGTSAKARFLPDFPVNADLHTRREQFPDDSLKRLGAELETGIRNGRLGIMIHHQLMNDAAFELLEDLLRSVAENGSLTPVTFRELHRTESI